MVSSRTSVIYLPTGEETSAGELIYAPFADTRKNASTEAQTEMTIKLIQAFVAISLFIGFIGFLIYTVR